MLKNHKGIPHGGVVFRSGVTGLAHQNKHIIEYRLQLDSNPEFTASVLTAYARAAYRLNREGQFGCKTVLDIAPAYLHQGTPEELRENYCKYNNGGKCNETGYDSHFGSRQP